MESMRINESYSFEGGEEVLVKRSFVEVLNDFITNPGLSDELRGELEAGIYVASNMTLGMVSPKNLLLAYLKEDQFAGKEILSEWLKRSLGAYIISLAGRQMVGEFRVWIGDIKAVGENVEINCCRITYNEHRACLDLTQLLRGRVDLRSGVGNYPYDEVISLPMGDYFDHVNKK